MSFDLKQLNGRKLYDREAGMLMPIFSLPGKYGIGDLGYEAEGFIDILANSNQQLWAMLPNGPISYGNSPYQSPSAFAGNYYFISPDKLVKEGLLTETEANFYNIRENEEGIDYGSLFKYRTKMLKCAYKRWLNQGGNRSQEFLKFKFQNYNWLKDYSLYMGIKENMGYKPWYEWPEKYKNRDKEALIEANSKYSEDIHFWEFTQFQFFKQWQQIKEYANEKGVKLIGDIPYYLSHDSADVWAHKELFALNKDGSISLLSGRPGDNGSSICWGNPCYNWQNMEKEHYAWMGERIKKFSEMYDIIRIDHAIAFVDYFGMTDRYTPGKWYAGPDKYNSSATKVINAVATEKNMDIIVENLGNNTQRSHDLYDQLNWLGMRIFDYAIGDNTYGTRNIHLPIHYPQNVAAYTGTHDNESLAGIISNKSEKDLEYIMAFMRVDKKEDIIWGAIDTLYKSPAAKVIIPVQDILSLGNDSRVCYLDDYERSWNWRLPSLNYIDEKIQTRLRGLSDIGGRGWMNDKRIKEEGWQQIMHKAIQERYGR